MEGKSAGGKIGPFVGGDSQGSLEECWEATNSSLGNQPFGYLVIKCHDRKHQLPGQSPALVASMNNLEINLAIWYLCNHHRQGVESTERTAVPCAALVSLALPTNTAGQQPG